MKCAMRLHVYPNQKRKDLCELAPWFASRFRETIMETKTRAPRWSGRRRKNMRRRSTRGKGSGKGNQRTTNGSHAVEKKRSLEEGKRLKP